MTLKRPLFQQAAGGDPTFDYSALDTRELIRGLFHQEGIIAPDVVFGALKVTQRAAGANFSVDVAAGACVIEGDDVTDQGYYVCQSTAVENRVIPAPPGAGTRVHRVVARVKDKLHNGSWTTYEWTIEVLEDTGSGTPATPASAISLATVSVAAAQPSVQNANITDTRLSAALISSKYPLVAADASRPPLPYESELIWRTDKDYYEAWNGSAWRIVGPPPTPTQVLDSTVIGSITSTSYAAGSPVVGTTFVAPPSGKVIITVSGNVEQSNNGNFTALGWELKTGGTIGSGTQIENPAFVRAIVCGRPVNTSAAIFASGSMRHMQEGLTPGSTYNVRTMHRVTGGSGEVSYRALLIEPVS